MSYLQIQSSKSYGNLASQIEYHQIKKTQTQLPQSVLQNFKIILTNSSQKINMIFNRFDTDLDRITGNSPKCMVQMLKKSLQVLKINPNKVLHDNILQLYLQISEINQQIKNLDNSKQILIKLIDQLLQVLSPLISEYFIAKEYEKVGSQNQQVNIIDHKSENLDNDNQVIKSPKLISNTLKQINKEEQLDREKKYDEIRNKFKNFSIDQFLERYIQHEKNQIIDSYEVCRICERQVKLKNIIKHMKNCSSKAELQAQFHDLKIEWEEVIKQIRLKQEQICRIPPSKRKQKQILILNFIKDSKNKQYATKRIKQTRRNSHISNFSSYKTSISDLQQQYQSYSQKFGKNQLFQKIIRIQRQEQANQKLQNSLQMNELRLSNANNQNDVQDYGCLVKSMKHVQSQGKIKKSIFQKSQQNVSKVSSSQSSSSQSISLSSNSQKQLKQNKPLGHKQTLNILCNASKKTLHQYNDQKPDITQNLQKRWRSLQVIPFSTDQKQNNICLKDFQILKFLGKGAYGSVYLVRRTKTKSLYALKHIRCNEQTSNAQIQLIKKQHEIFRKIAGQHLVKAPFSFSQKFGLFFVLQFMPGGDLSKILEEQIYLEEEHAKFYLAETVLALEYLHSCDIIHRDLKPQNLVIDKQGHLKLTDFGLSQIKMRHKIQKTLATQQKNIQNYCKNRKNNRRQALVAKPGADKIIGTPDYIAPQIINRTSINNKSIDWWSLGILTYEILIGCRPFSADNIEQILNNILEGKIMWPEIGQEQGMISSQAVDLIQKLLNKDFKNRLGGSGTQQIKKHPFFKGIDWQNIKMNKPPQIKNLQYNIYEDLKEDVSLRKQIEMHKNCKSRSSARSKSIKIDTFVRYDLLLEQTFESMQKKINEKNNKLKRLQSLKTSTIKKGKQPKNKNKKIRFSIDTFQQ